MRINNPKSLVGFTRTANVDELAYNLATIGQLKNAVASVTSGYLHALYGTENYGISTGHGYAWLNGEGKVEPSLLPALAITDTHVVKQSTLKNAGSLPTSTQNVDWDSEFEKLLNMYLEYSTTAAGGNYKYQKGDIVIVSVDGNEVPDPVYAGSYIITQVPDNQHLKYQFSKLAYTDSNIVKINGLVPSNSAGEVHIYLKHILQELYYDQFNSAASGYVEANAAAQALENTVYRLKTINEGDNGYRFAFIDNSNAGQGAVVPYAKLAELNAVDTRENTHFTNLTNAINTLRENTFESIEATSSFLSGEIDSLSGRLSGEVDLLSNNTFAQIGYKSDIANRALSATIYAQTKQLRSDVDLSVTNVASLKNATISSFTQLRDNVNSMLDLINTNVSNLHTGLEKTAVKMYTQDFTWIADEATVTQFTEINMYNTSAEGVSGVISWTHKHIPSNVGTGNLNSEERIVAIYNEAGELVNADVKIVKNDATGLTDTHINVETEFVGYTDSNALKNTLAGQTWKMLIAKTISGINFNNGLQSVGYGTSLNSLGF